MHRDRASQVGAGAASAGGCHPGASLLPGGTSTTSCFAATVSPAEGRPPVARGASVSRRACPWPARPGRPSAGRPTHGSASSGVPVACCGRRAGGRPARRRCCLRPTTPPRLRRVVRGRRRLAVHGGARRRERGCTGCDHRVDDGRCGRRGAMWHEGERVAPEQRRHPVCVLLPAGVDVRPGVGGELGGFQATDEPRRAHVVLGLLLLQELVPRHTAPNEDEQCEHRESRAEPVSHSTRLRRLPHVRSLGPPFLLVGANTACATWAPKHPQAVTVLVLGILGIVVCGLCGPFAWSMGNKAEREMAASARPVERWQRGHRRQDPRHRVDRPARPGPGRPGRLRGSAA